MTDPNAFPRERKHARKPVRVGIVDDHLLLLESLSTRLALRSSGIVVVISETTWSGFVSHPEYPVDVAVLDLQLDDGIPIGTKLRALSASGTGTVVMSRHAHAATVAEAMRAGALSFVPKTEPVEDLISAIHAAAANTTMLSDALAAAVAAFPASPNPGLGRQEQRALMLYASGRSIKEVAVEMETTDETVKSYIKRGRRKYRAIGIDLGTRIRLRMHGIREGWISPD